MIAADTAAVATPAPTVATTPSSQDQAIAQINGVLTNELAKVAEFDLTTGVLMENEKLKIDNASRSAKTYLIPDFTRDQKLVVGIAQSQKVALDKVPQQLQTVLARKSEAPQLFLDKLKAGVVKMEADRQRALKLLSLMDAEIAEAVK